MRGRPPIAGAKRNKHVAAYFTEKEQELIKVVAESLNMTVSDYVRTTLLSDASKLAPRGFFNPPASELDPVDKRARIMAEDAELDALGQQRHDEALAKYNEALARYNAEYERTQNNAIQDEEDADADGSDTGGNGSDR